MMILSTIFLFSTVIFYIVSMGLFISAYRNLSDYQFKNHHDNWVSDGRPKGGEITRSEITFIKSEIAANFCILSWLFKRPAWLAEGSDGELYRFKMIRWSIVSLIAFLAAGSGVIFFACVISTVG